MHETIVSLATYGLLKSLKFCMELWYAHIWNITEIDYRHKEVKASIPH